MQEADCLAAVYGGLARALAAREAWPDWLSLAGRDWPLWRPVMGLAQLALAEGDGRFQTIALALAAVPRAAVPRRRGAYERFFVANGQAPLALYGAQALNGRLLGPEMGAVQAFYQQVGLTIEGGQLPDHAAVELEFLCFLAEQEGADDAQSGTWRAVRRRFVGQHAGRWLPAVGGRLAAGDDPAWVVVGLLLTAVLTPPPQAPRPEVAVGRGWPQIEEAAQCHLCGFCAQACPTQALWVGEDTAVTRLHLVPELCLKCRRCAQICPEQALTLTAMTPLAAGARSVTVLRQSPRAVCPTCGVTMVSEAELAAVGARLGQPAWLRYCQACRIS